MDTRLLSQKGLSVRDPQAAVLANYGLRIGERALVIPSPEEEVYGIVMDIDAEELDILYAEESVEDYRPEVVRVQSEGKTLTAYCYSLPPESAAGSNPQYAQALYTLAKSLGFPPSYLDRIIA